VLDLVSGKMIPLSNATIVMTGALSVLIKHLLNIQAFALMGID